MILEEFLKPNMKMIVMISFVMRMILVFPKQSCLHTSRIRLLVYSISTLRSGCYVSSFQRAKKHI
jgi:hypothetical protein